ncbi:MAG: FtsX-like permease family protein [Gammaproteobacteria bacterium]|jgi:ABC-type lipoprotein release transport system permease subunit
MGIVFNLAWRNLWRNRRRTWLTAGAIMFSTVLLVGWVPIQFGTYDIMINASLRVFPGHAQIQPPGYQDKPKIRNVIDNAEQLARSLRGNELYEGVAVRAQGFALLSSGTRSYGAQVVGVQPEYEGGTSSIPGLVKQGRFLSSIDAQELVIGSALARNLNLTVGDEVTVLGSGKDGSVAAAILPVVGIFESGSNEFDRYFAEIPLHTFQNVFSMGNSAHTIAVVGKSLEQQAQLLSALNSAIRGRDDIVVLGWDELLPGMKEAIQVDKTFGFIFYGILIAIVVFSILNTFLMSVLERTREFGLMLALGARPTRIAALMVLESAMLTLLGLVIGMIIGTALVYWAHVVGIHYPGVEDLAEQFNLPNLSRIYPEMKAFNFLLGPVSIFICTNIAAWIPILRVRKLEPVEAMRTI